MKKVIAFHDESGGLGGTTRYLLSLLGGIDRNEFDLIFFALRSAPWHERLVAGGVEVHTLRSAEPLPSPAAVTAHSGDARGAARKPKLPPGIAWSLGLAREIAELKRLFGRRHFDLLHTNQAGAEPAPIAARMGGASCILATWHVDSTYDLNRERDGTRYRFLEKACMRSLDHAISVSKATACDWIKRCRLGNEYWQRVSVIHNGVDLRDLRRQRSIEAAKAAEGLAGRLVIVSTGRLDAAKGYEYLIRALPDVVRTRPDVLVRIAGRGELLEPLKQLASATGVNRHIDFVGFTQDVRGFLETGDIYVQPSLCEALPFAVLEAAAVAMPVVASDVGGVSECVANAESGFVVPPRDPASLTQALTQLVSDVSLRERMGQRGYQLVVENFQLHQMNDKTVELYRSLLK
jgi:glycosyltransferase involved in cell wall biosynthesis